MKVVTSDFAGQEILKTAKYIQREFGKRSRDNFLQKVRETKSLLSSNPDLGPEESLLEGRPISYRSIVVAKVNKIVYRIMEDRIEIVDFWDVRREPKALSSQVE